MQQRINLVPQEPIAERIKKLIPLVFGAMALLFTLTFLAWTQLLNIRIIDLNTTIAHIEEQANQSTEINAQLASLKQNLKTKNKNIDQKSIQIAQLSKIRGQKKEFSQPLSLIAALLPDSIRCRKISFTGAAGELQGIALDYNDLVWMVRSMQDLNIFKKVSLSVTDRATNKEQERIEFTIIIHLV